MLNGQAVVITGAAGIASTVIEQDFVAVCLGTPVSITCSVKVDEPAAVAAPEIDPPDVSVKPAGKAPALIEYVSAPTPPDVESVWLNAAPAVALFNGQAVVIVGTGCGRPTTNVQ